MKIWKFDQGPNVAAITTESILRGSPILCVYHELDDHSWQFLGEEEAIPENAAIVSMMQIVTIDSTVEEVSHIKPGHVAVRDFKGDTWKVRKY